MKRFVDGSSCVALKPSDARFSDVVILTRRHTDLGSTAGINKPYWRLPLMAESERSKPTLSVHRAYVWAHFGFYSREGRKEFDKRQSVCETCRAKWNSSGRTTYLRAYLTRYTSDDVQLTSNTFKLTLKAIIKLNSYHQNNSVYTLFYLQTCSLSLLYRMTASVTWCEYNEASLYPYPNDNHTRVTLAVCFLCFPGTQSPCGDSLIQRRIHHYKAVTWKLDVWSNPSPFSKTLKWIDKHKHIYHNMHVLVRTHASTLQSLNMQLCLQYCNICQCRVVTPVLWCISSHQILAKTQLWIPNHEQVGSLHHWMR